jgi:hypothetical protein
VSSSSSLRLEHAAVAGLTAGLVATAAGPSSAAPSATTCATLRCVAGWAHISRFIAGASSKRAALDRPGQAQVRLSNSSSARPWASLAMKSALAGASTMASAFAAEVDVRHVVGLARVPLAGEHRPAGQRLHRHRGDELLGGLGHHHLHGGPGLDQFARQLGGLVAGDAAGQPQHDMTKFVFVTGGVVSSLGKGIASASLAAILESRGLKVTLIKLDPYLNVDPGTMSRSSTARCSSPTTAPRPTSTSATTSASSPRG